MRMLNDLEFVECENSADYLQMRMPERHAVARDLLVHRSLGSRPHDIVEKERRDEQRDDQRRKYPAEPEENPMLSISTHRAPRLNSHGSRGTFHAAALTVSAEGPDEERRQSEPNAEQQMAPIDMLGALAKRGLTRLLAECRDLSAWAVASRIQRAVNDFGSEPSSDDMAILVLRVQDSVAR